MYYRLFLFSRSVAISLIFSTFLKASENVSTSLDPYGAEEKLESESDACPVCLEDFLTNDLESAFSKKKIEVCAKKHVMCVECFIELRRSSLNKVCPVCRADFASDTIHIQALELRGNEAVRIRRLDLHVGRRHLSQESVVKLITLGGGICCIWYFVLFFHIIKIHKEPKSDDQDDV